MAALEPESDDMSKQHIGDDEHIQYHLEQIRFLTTALNRLKML